MKKLLIASVMCIMIVLCSSCQPKNVQPLEVPSKKVKTKTFSNDQFSFEYPSKLNVDTYESNIFLSYSGMEDEAIQIVVKNDEKNFNILALKRETEKNAKAMAVTNKKLGLSISAEIASIPAGNVLVTYANTEQDIFDGTDRMQIFLPDRKNKRSITFAAESNEDNYERQKETLLIIANSFKFNQGN